jgi:hypothetical protein
MEFIGGPERPPKGMECLTQTRSLEPDAEVYSGCKHGENSITYISSVILIRIKDNGARVVQCRVCGQMWERFR